MEMRQDGIIFDDGTGHGIRQRLWQVHGIRQS